MVSDSGCWLNRFACDTRQGVARAVLWDEVVENLPVLGAFLHVRGERVGMPGRRP